MKLTRLFIEQAFPPSQGWEVTNEVVMHGVQMAFVLRNGQFCVLIPKLSAEPFVSNARLTEARNLIKLFYTHNEDMFVQVVMVYKHLLCRPMHVSDKDIVIVSIEDCPLLTKTQTNYVYAN